MGAFYQVRTVKAEGLFKTINGGFFLKDQRNTRGTLKEEWVGVQ